MKTHPNDQNPSKVTFKSITFLFATVALIATSSCNKNDKYTNYDLLVEKEWKLTSIERNGAEIGEQCDFDDVLSFENEKDFTYDHGACDENELEETGDSWKLTDDFTILRMKFKIRNGTSFGSTLQYWDIESIIDTMLVISDANAEDNNMAPETRTFKL